MMASTWSFPQFHRLREDFFTSCKYKIRKVLGKGVYGQVVLATSTSGREDIAVKILPRLGGDTHHFMDEAKALWNLQYPRLMKMRMAAYCPRFHYIVMDVYPNGNLFKTIPHLDNIYKVFDFVIDIASGILYLHRNRVVHRDLKTDNILIDSTNHAVLADFGMAIQMPPNQDTCSESFGNFYWRAPELRKDSVEPFCPFKAEMFTVGVIFWTMVLKSQYPDVSGDFVSMMNERSGQIPYFMREAIQNLLSPEPQSRRSCVELLNKLYHDIPPYSNVIKRELGSDWVSTGMNPAEFRARGCTY